MERERLEVGPELLVDSYDRLRSVMTDLPAGLVFHPDEAGYREWADRTHVKVIVPDSFERDTVEIPLNRSDNRTSLLACISAAGANLPPLIIVPRATTEQELYEIGYIPDKVLLRHQANGFINTELFTAWVMQVFLPWVNKRREELEYQGWAVLLLSLVECDNGRVHVPRNSVGLVTPTLIWSDKHGVLFVKVDPSTARRLRASRTQEDTASHRKRLHIRV
jgi:hypothetical protein